MARKVYVGIENFVPVELPEGYTQVGYIESSGTQYIDTGFKPNQNTRVVMDLELLSNDNIPYIFGVFNDSLANSFSAFWWSNGSNSWGADFGIQRSAVNQTVWQKRLTVDYNKNVISVDGVSHTFTVEAFSAPNNLTLLALNGKNSLAGYTATAKLYSCQIYDNGTQIRNYIPCINSNGLAGLYDIVNGTFNVDTAGGTFIAGSTNKSVARNVNKIYVGVNNIARKVKKAYIGIGNIARLFWAKTGLYFFGMATSISEPCRISNSTVIGDYALFHFGSYKKTINAYNSALIRSIPTALNKGKDQEGATSVGSYALFGGGRTSGNTTGQTEVEAYNKSLTKTVLSTGLSEALSRNAAESVGNYAIFAGGCTPSDVSSATVNAFNSSLTRSVITSLGLAREVITPARIDGYALFCGGYDGNTQSNRVDAYNTSLTRSTPPLLSEKKMYMAAASTNSHALIAGGYLSNSKVSAKVEAYNKSLTRTLLTELSVARYEFGATTIHNCAIFAGGSTTVSFYDDSVSNVIDVYDASLTRMICEPLKIKRCSNALETIGNYALVVGGWDGQYQKHLSDVEVYSCYD